MDKLLKRLKRPLRNVTTQKNHGFVFSESSPVTSTKKEEEAYEIIKKVTSFDLTPDIWMGLSAGHINCGNCRHPFFYLTLTPKESLLLSGCAKCHSEGRISLKGILNEELVLKDEEGNIKYTADLECPKEHNQFALLKSGTTCCIGCKSCSYQLEFTLSIRNGIWIQ